MSDMYIRLDDVLSLLESYCEGYHGGLEEKQLDLPPGHCSCCTCQCCGYDYDDCVCGHNQIVAIIRKMVIPIKAITGSKEE